jgi:uncharacterized protein
MVFTPNRITILGGVLLVLLILTLLTLFGGLGIRYLFGFHHMTALYLFITRSQYWLFLLVLWLYSTRIERQKLLIWPEKNYTFWASVLSLVVITAAIFTSLVIAFMVIRLLLHKNESSTLMKQMVSIFKGNPFLLVYTAFTAGVTEELIVRGYLLPRLQVLLKSPFLAIAISALIFGMAHFGYGTIINVVAPFIIGLALAFYYWEYRNIKIIILFHFLWDLAGLYLQTRHG